MMVTRRYTSWWLNYEYIFNDVANNAYTTLVMLIQVHQRDQSELLRRAEDMFLHLNDQPKEPRRTVPRKLVKWRLGLELATNLILELTLSVLEPTGDFLAQPVNVVMCTVSIVTLRQSKTCLLRELPQQYKMRIEQFTSWLSTRRCISEQV